MVSFLQSASTRHVGAFDGRQPAITAATSIAKRLRFIFTSSREAYRVWQQMPVKTP
jgi:hypothetical protein